MDKNITNHNTHHTLRKNTQTIPLPSQEYTNHVTPKNSKFDFRTEEISTKEAVVNIGYVLEQHKRVAGLNW